MVEFILYFRFLGSSFRNAFQPGKAVKPKQWQCWNNRRPVATVTKQVWAFCGIFISLFGLKLTKIISIQSWKSCWGDETTSQVRQQNLCFVSLKNPKQWSYNVILAMKTEIRLWIFFHPLRWWPILTSRGHIIVFLPSIDRSSLPELSQLPPSTRTSTFKPQALLCSCEDQSQ